MLQRLMTMIIISIGSLMDITMFYLQGMGAEAHSEPAGIMRVMKMHVTIQLSKIEEYSSTRHNHELSYKCRSMGSTSHRGAT